MHETTVLLIEVGALLLVLSLLGRLALRVGISPIPLYLLAGLAVGHGGFLPFDASESFFEVGSQIGVILLLAMLGLEYSAEELLSSLKRARVAGLMDGLLNAVPGAAFALIMGWGWLAAVALGGVTWISSSGVIAKVLRDLGRLGNRETPVVLSVLVIEDLAMEFDDTPPDFAGELANLRNAQTAIEDALVPIMTGVVRLAGWMDPS